MLLALFLTMPTSGFLLLRTNSFFWDSYCTVTVQRFLLSSCSFLHYVYSIFFPRRVSMRSLPWENSFCGKTENKDPGSKGFRCILGKMLEEKLAPDPPPVTLNSRGYPVRDGYT